jgi:hypothetical protein
LLDKKSGFGSGEQIGISRPFSVKRNGMMKKAVLAGLFAVLMSLFTVAGDVLELKDGHPDTHVVKKGDTLWDISNLFLKSPWLWPEIWHVNPQIDNPHLIYPGDVLNLVYIDGKPRLVLKRNQDVKLSPQVRISELDLAIPAIPLDAIAPFLTQSRVVGKNDLEAAPYVLAGKGGHIVSGAGDELYARGEFNKEEDTFGIFRRGDAYVDPDSGEFLGIQAFAVASAKLVAIDGEVGTLALNQTTEEVRVADRLLPDEGRNIRSNFHPSAPEQETDGYIIAVEGGVSQIGFLDVVVLNKGDRDNLKVGNVLAIFHSGEHVRDQVTKEIVKVPDTRAGLLMVFRTFDKVSYGLVLKATQPLAINDRVANP